MLNRPKRRNPARGRDLGSQRPRLRVESLEDRRMLAGNVDVVVTVDGDLTATGDSLDNEFVIERIVTGVIRVQGLNGTTITFESMTAASHDLSNEFIDPQGIDRDVVIDTGEGNDSVTFNALNVGRDFMATTLGGNDTVIVENADVADDLSILTGSGHDNMQIRFSDVTGDASLVGSSGDEYTYIDSLFLSTALTFDGGSGDDTFVGYFLEEFNATYPVDVTLNGGADNDSLSLTGTTINGSTTIDGGNGDDTIYDSESALGGNLVIEGGDGVEDVTVQNGSVFGDLAIHVRSGVTGMADPIAITGMVVNGKTSARGSGGNQQVTLVGNTLLQLDIVLGGGNDTVNITNSSSTLTKFKTGSGADTVTLTNGTFNSTLTVEAGGGIDTISTGANDSFNFFVTLDGGQNHNDVGNLSQNFMVGANITSIENLSLLAGTV